MGQAPQPEEDGLVDHGAQHRGLRLPARGVQRQVGEVGRGARARRTGVGGQELGVQSDAALVGQGDRGQELGRVRRVGQIVEPDGGQGRACALQLGLVDVGGPGPRQRQGHGRAGHEGGRAQLRVAHQRQDLADLPDRQSDDVHQSPDELDLVHDGLRALRPGVLIGADQPLADVVLDRRDRDAGSVRQHRDGHGLRVLRIPRATPGPPGAGTPAAGAPGGPPVLLSLSHRHGQIVVLSTCMWQTFGERRFR